MIFFKLWLATAIISQKAATYIQHDIILWPCNIVVRYNIPPKSTSHYCALLWLMPSRQRNNTLITVHNSASYYRKWDHLDCQYRTAGPECTRTNFTAIILICKICTVTWYICVQYDFSCDIHILTIVLSGPETSQQLLYYWPWKH